MKIFAHDQVHAVWLLCLTSAPCRNAKMFARGICLREPVHFDQVNLSAVLNRGLVWGVPLVVILKCFLWVFG